MRVQLLTVDGENQLLVSNHWTDSPEVTILFVIFYEDDILMRISAARQPGPGEGRN